MPTGLGDEKLWLCPTLDNVTPFNDLSDQANNGTAFGGTVTVADTSAGGAYAYDLNGSKSVRNSTLDLSTLRQFSFSVWFKSTSTSGDQMILSWGNTTSHSTDTALVHLRTSDLLMQADGKSGGTSSLPSINTWHHLTFVVDGDNADTSKRMLLYLDGQLVLSPAIASIVEMYSPASFTCNLGELNGVSNFGLIGLADDFRVFTRVLNQAEIAHLAEARGIIGSPPQGLGDEQLWLCPSINNSPNDISGNGNNGVYQGGMGTITSDGKLAYDFDGTDDYIDCGNILNFTGPFSVSYWVLNDSTDKAMYISKDWDGSTEGYISRFDGGASGPLRFYTYQGSIFGTSVQNPFTVSQWSCVTNVYTGTHWEIYFDGVRIAQTAQTQSPFSNTGNLFIGATSIAGWNVDGRMDDIRFFDRALNQAEIVHLAEARGITGSPPQGLGDEKLWLCPSINNSPNDISGNGNNGVYQGGMGTIADTSNGGSLAYDNDSGNQFVEVAGTIGTTVVSTALWVKRTAVETTTVWWCGSNAYSGPLWSDAVSSYAGADYIRAGDVLSPAISPTLPSSGDWFHLCTVSSGGATDIYVDGVLHDSVTTASPSATTEEFRLGSSNGVIITSSKYYDDIRVYDRTLTQAEIVHLAEARGITGSPPQGLGDEQLWLCPSINNSPNDISGNGNDGVYGASVTTVSDTSNGGTLAYNFPNTGPTNTITINDFDLGGLSQLTWSAWIYDNTEAVSIRHGSFFSWRSSGGTGSDDILFHDYERQLLAFQVNNNQDGGAIYSPVYPQDWKHYCVVFDGTNPTATDRLSMYINGVLQVPDTTFAYPATTTTIAGTKYAEIGDYVGNTNWGTFNFKGKQDDIRIFDRAITQAEITHLATSRGIEGPPPVGLGDEKLWLCPTLNASTADLSGNGNSTSIGSSTIVTDGAYKHYDDTVTTLASSSINDLGPMSWSLWVRSSLNTASGLDVFITKVTKYLALRQGSSNNQKFDFFIDGSGGDAVGNSAYISPTPYRDTWTHVVVTWDGTFNPNVGAMYIDGVYVVDVLAGAGTAKTDAASDLAIGTSTADTDDIRLYGRTLTQAEITHLATSRGIEGGPSTPTAQYNAFATHAFKQLFQQRLR